MTPGLQLKRAAPIRIRDHRDRRRAAEGDQPIRPGSRLQRERKDLARAWTSCRFFNATEVTSDGTNRRSRFMASPASVPSKRSNSLPWWKAREYHRPFRWRDPPSATSAGR